MSDQASRVFGWASLCHEFMPLFLHLFEIDKEFFIKSF